MTKTTTSTTTPLKKTYAPEDLIDCRSLVNGALYIKGDRSGFIYNWADYGDVVGIEYRDLIYMIRSSGNSFIYEPRIIIENEDIVKEYPSVEKIYSTMYSITDLKDAILNTPIISLKDTIDALPSGVKRTMRGLISDMIDNRSLDSVQRIKALDSIFGTDMLLTLAQN